MENNEQRSIGLHPVYTGRFFQATAKGEPLAIWDQYAIVLKFQSSQLVAPDPYFIHLWLN